MMAAVIVGNIGASRRLKYSVVGNAVNMASRIESYSVGGQILATETVRQKAGDLLLVDGTEEIIAKGSELPARVYTVSGISGAHNLVLNTPLQYPVPLEEPIPLTFAIVTAKQVDSAVFDAFYS